MVDDTARQALRRYENEASFYDTLYNPTEDLAFWKRCAAGAKGPILECACGTGRVTIPLARAGHQVTGIDLSGEMLRKAHDNVAKEAPSIRRRIAFVRADMRKVRLGQKFGLCLVPFFSFHHLLTDKDQEDALRRIRSHLFPEGRLIFNVFNPDLTRPEGLQRLDKVIENKGETVMRYSTQWFDKANHLTYGWLVYEFIKPDGVVRRKLTPFKLRYFFRQDIEKLFRKMGFSIVSIFGGYDRRAFKSKDSMMIFIAKPSRS